MNDLEAVAEAMRRRASRGLPARTVRPAPAGARCGALAIDSIALGIAYITALPIFDPSTLRGLSLPPEADALFACGIWLVFSLIEVVPGYSLGKWIVGLAITSSTAQPASRGRLAVRWAIKYAFALLAALWQAVDGWVLYKMRHNSSSAMPSEIVIINHATTLLQMTTIGATTLIAMGMIGIYLPGRRALHDWLSGTAVYNEQDLVSDSSSPGRAFEIQPQAHHE